MISSITREFSPFDRPIVIIGCNRFGTTLLFNILSVHPVTWSLYIESQTQFHRRYPIHPVQGERVGDAPSDAVRAQILEDFFRSAHNKQYSQQFPLLSWLPDRLFQRPVRHLYRRAPLRLVEKTPANSLRIPLVASLFPDARFIHIVRRGEDVVSSLMEGWKHWSRARQGNWSYTGWHYLVPPGWQNQVQKTLQEICTFQWTKSNRFALADLQRIDPQRRMLVRHEDLIPDPIGMYRQILAFCELD